MKKTSIRKLQNQKENMNQKKKKRKYNKDPEPRIESCKKVYEKNKK